MLEVVLSGALSHASLVEHLLLTTNSTFRSIQHYVLIEMMKKNSSSVQVVLGKWLFSCRARWDGCSSLARQGFNLLFIFRLS